MIIRYALFLLTFTINTYTMLHIDENPTTSTQSEKPSKAIIPKICFPTSTEQIETLHKKIKNIEQQLQSPQSKNWNQIKKQEALRKINKKTLKIKIINKKDLLEQTEEFKKYRQNVKNCGFENYSPTSSDFFESYRALTKSIKVLQNNQCYKDLYSLNKKKLFLSAEQKLLMSLQRNKHEIDDHIKDTQLNMTPCKQYLHSTDSRNCESFRKKAIRIFIKMEKKKIKCLSRVNELIKLQKTTNYLKILQDCKTTDSCDTSLQLEQAFLALQHSPTFVYCEKLTKKIDVLDMAFTEQVNRDRLPQYPSRIIVYDDFGRYFNLIPPSQ